MSPFNSESNAVTRVMFSRFWGWFVNILDCLRDSALWGYTSPRLLHGFISKDDAISMLTGLPVGTFLLRCSESRIKTLVVAYVASCDRVSNIQFVQLRSISNGEFEMQIGKQSLRFLSLRQLVLEVKSLVWLYPNIPKHEAFSPLTKF